MKAIRILSRRKAINTKLALLHAKQILLEEELFRMEKECNHEILVRLPKITAPKNMSITGYINESTYCLICDEYLSPRKYVPKEDMDKMKKSIVIDLGKYPNFHKKIRHNWRKRLESMYESIVKENPKLSTYEVAKKMIEQIEILEKKLGTSE